MNVFSSLGFSSFIYLKGQKAEDSGNKTSNFNRKERFGWQIAGIENPSPGHYRPNEETCQGTYHYSWDQDPKGRKVRKSKQITLLKARQRRGT